MYTKDDLENAFESGRTLQFVEDNESEGYSDSPYIDYESFEEWFNLNYNEYTKDS
jgi:hypothetical protein